MPIGLVRKKNLLLATAMAGGWLASAHAEPAKTQAPAIQPSPAPEAPPSSGSIAQRNFYEVLEDLLADFEYDLKTGSVLGLRDVAFRNIATSENIPPSYKGHLELVLTERILKTSKTKVIQCLACRSRKATVMGDAVTISAPDNNPIELSRIAKTAGILHFIDAAFSYQPSGMVLSLSVSDPESGGIIWSRSYNSETSRAAQMRRGVDNGEIADAPENGELPTQYQGRFILFYAFEPNLSGTTGCIGLAYRRMERYDYRKKEVGFELSAQKDASSLTSNSSSVSATAAAENLWGSFGFSAIFLHAWNLFGEEENINGTRSSVFGGIGGTYASGYLGPLIRGGYEWRMAKHWTFSGMLGFRPSSTFTPSTSTTGTSVSGAEYGVGVNYIF